MSAEPSADAGLLAAVQTAERAQLRVFSQRRRCQDLPKTSAGRSDYCGVLVSAAEILAVMDLSCLKVSKVNPPIGGSLPPDVFAVVLLPFYKLSRCSHEQQQPFWRV